MTFYTNAIDLAVAFWHDYQTLIRIVLMVIGVIVLRAVLLISVRRVVRGIIAGVKGKTNKAALSQELDSPMTQARVVQRAKTMGSVLSNFITWSLYILGASMILGELGVAVGAIIAGAGILGAAIGFGAQSLVRDLISGLFIVFEDQYGVGDVVDLGQANGVVESVGMRVTQVRDVQGTLWYVRNGEIVRVGNSSQGWSRVVLDIALDYSTNVDKATTVISDAAQKLIAEAPFKSSVIGKPEVWGIEALSGEQVVLRIVQQVKPTKQDELARELRARIKKALHTAKISLAASNQNIYVEVAGKAVK